MMKKIIFDCDNTMGISGCDVDDGLALLYLLGEGSAELCGITTTYGNSDADTVYANTLKLLQEIGQTSIAVYKGCPGPATLQSEAVDFIVEEVNTYPHQISILATGSLTNLLGAYQKDRELFTKIAEIVLMGGITKELRIGGHLLKELNFSCDPAAAEQVLWAGKKLSVLTGNNCLEAYFSGREFGQKLELSSQPVARYILQQCNYWLHELMAQFGLDGFYGWDVVAAAYLVRPELFEDQAIMITPNTRDLRGGWLLHRPWAKVKRPINIPGIKNAPALRNEIYNSWLRLDIPEQC